MKKPKRSSGVAPIENLGELGDKRIRVDMTPNEAVEFINKLASDDEFRARFQTNPRACAAQYHIQLPAGQVPTLVKLPPKSELKRAIRAISFGKEFRTESAALMAAATYAWFHVVFTGYRFGLAPSRKGKSRA